MRAFPPGPRLLDHAIDATEIILSFGRLGRISPNACDLSWPARQIWIGYGHRFSHSESLARLRCRRDPCLSKKILFLPANENLLSLPEGDTLANGACRRMLF